MIGLPVTKLITPATTMALNTLSIYSLYIHMFHKAKSLVTLASQERLTPLKFYSLKVQSVLVNNSD
jgi:hypothetical protein